MCAHDYRVRASVQRLSGCAKSYARASKVRATLDVQVGTATNFLADQMLKTRAGENVLALMAAHGAGDGRGIKHFSSRLLFRKHNSFMESSGAVLKDWRNYIRKSRGFVLFSN